MQKVTNTAMSPVTVPTTRVMAHRFAARRLLVVHHLLGDATFCKKVAMGVGLDGVCRSDFGVSGGRCGPKLYA